MTQELLSKINELSKKEKEQGLTPQEKELQAQLRDEYRKEFVKTYFAKFNKEAYMRL